MQKYKSKPRVRKPSHQDHPGQKRQERQALRTKINSKRASGIILVAVIIFGLLGAGITFFAVDNLLWIISVGIIGMCGGYLFGVQIVKGLSKK